MNDLQAAALGLLAVLLASQAVRAAETDYAGMLLTNQSLLKDPPVSCGPNELLNTFQLQQCSAVAFKKADGEMNQAYQAALKGGDAARNKALQAVQRLWLSLRNGECAWESSKYEGGTLAPVVMGNCLVDITRARTKVLTDDLSP